MDKEQINELLLQKGTMDLKTFYWLILKEKIEVDFTEADTALLNQLEEQLTQGLSEAMGDVFAQWLEVQARLKDEENYASFLAGVRHGLKLFLDILG